MGMLKRLRLATDVEDKVRGPVTNARREHRESGECTHNMRILYLPDLYISFEKFCVEISNEEAEKIKLQK